jgi:hypothetical protein
MLRDVADGDAGQIGLVITRLNEDVGNGPLCLLQAQLGEIGCRVHGGRIAPLCRPTFGIVTICARAVPNKVFRRMFQNTLIRPMDIP